MGRLSVAPALPGDVGMPIPPFASHFAGTSGLHMDTSILMWPSAVAHEQYRIYNRAYKFNRDTQSQIFELSSVELSLELPFTSVMQAK